ncbi:MAG: GDSL-type esterase/lipase family protein, partial [Paludibacter sp.]
MKTKLFLLFLSFSFNSLMATNIILNNFETGSPAVNSLYGASSSIVTNPVSKDNSTGNCLKISRTTTQWWEMIGFTVNFTVPANTVKFVHVLVDYTLSPALSIQLNGVGQIDQFNAYSNFGKWQDVVFAIPGGTGGLTVTSLSIMTDRAIKLNNSTTFGYIDEVILNDTQSFRNDIVLNNFEAGSPAVTAQYGAASSIATNPVSNGNSTLNCLKIGRTTTQWWEAVTFPVNFTVLENTTKYVHILVNCSLKPSLAISLNGSGQISQFNAYNDLENWQDVVFAINGGITGLTVTSLSIQNDIGVKLNNTITYEYIDEVVLSESQFPNYNYFTGNKLYDFEAATAGNITGINTYSSTKDVISYPVANPFITGINTTTNCGKRTALASAQWWSGFEFIFTKPVLVDVNHKTLHLMVTAPVAGQVVLLSVSQEGTSMITNIIRTITTANTWQDLVVDVSNLSYISGVRICLGNNSGTTAVGDYYFDQFSIDASSAPSSSILMNLSLDMNGQTVSPNGVHVAGDFNVWNTTSLELKDPNSDGIYEVSVPISNLNQIYSYKFLNGNSWGSEETVFGTCEFHCNRKVSVGNSTFTVPLVKFSSCNSTGAPIAGLKIACVGNSITEGAGNTSYSKSWPYQLRDLLGTGYYTENLGVSGRTMLKNGDYPWWNEPEYQWTSGLKPDVILIKLGTNDSKTWNWNAINYKADYIEMINKFRAINSNPIIYMVTPAKAYASLWGITDDVIKNQLIPILKQIAFEKAVNLVDMYNATTGMAANFPDNIHPNDAGAKIIAQKIKDNLLKVKPVIVQVLPQANPVINNSYQWFYNDAPIVGS